MGYFTFSRSDPQNEDGEGIQLDTSFRDEVVWYHTSTDTEPPMTGRDPTVCPFPVQSDRILSLPPMQVCTPTWPLAHATPTARGLTLLVDVTLHIFSLYAVNGLHRTHEKW